MSKNDCFAIYNSFRTDENDITKYDTAVPGHLDYADIEYMLELVDSVERLTVYFRCPLSRLKKAAVERAKISDTKAIMQSIEKLTDPYDNSINEKCARIKMAFMSKFNDEIARWYYVDGKKVEKKTILLPRDQVTWECTIQSR